MRIVHILDDVRGKGNGMVNVAIDNACIQRAAGHDVAMIAVGGDEEPLLAHYGIHYYPLNQEARLGNLFPCIRGYRKIIKEFRPEIVHSHTMTSTVIATVLRAFSRYATITTVHIEHNKSVPLLGIADRVIIFSEASTHQLEKRGIPRAKMRIVPNGSIGSPRQNNVKAYPPIALSHPAIVTVAGMHYHKGIIDLLNAFVLVRTRVPECQLYIIGDGPKINDFRSYTHNLNLAHAVHFEGYQPYPQQYLSPCDVFVLASHHESFPLALIEAREAGCAIVGTRVGGIPAVLDHGKAGLLVEPHNPEDLASAISSILVNTSLAEQLRNQASSNLEKFHVNRMVEDTLKIYQLAFQHYGLV